MFSTDLSFLFEDWDTGTIAQNLEGKCGKICDVPMDHNCKRRENAGKFKSVHNDHKDFSTLSNRREF
jgi:hypothetical protein